MNTASPASEQRRRFSRVLFQARAALECSTGRLPCQLLDLSLKGALVGLPEGGLPAVGTPCTLDLALDSGHDHIRMDTVVAHHGAGHIGLHCRGIDLDSITHLRRLLELNLGDAELLQRELSALAHLPEAD